jgi:ubiquinone/menaquinone biosynthesis C-methylase UbiE
MYRRARSRIKQAGVEVDRRVLGGERLPFEDGTFDCVVSTFTLCSIEEVAQALREVYRVLKAGGLFLFLEHGLSPELNVQKWQHRLNWLQVRLAGGCHLDRDMRAKLLLGTGLAARFPRWHGQLGVSTTSLLPDFLPPPCHR